uniref:GSKIP domain-containing protein n=1 Tax=Pavo cristatus TaxID=9049 RepID=A0A8C9LBF4_PAVCR
MGCAEAARPRLAPQCGLPAAGLPQCPSHGRWGGTACPQAPAGSSILTRPPPPPSSRRPASAEGTAAPHGTRGMAARRDWEAAGAGPRASSRRWHSRVGAMRTARRLPPHTSPTAPRAVTGTVTQSGSGVSERRRRGRKLSREARRGAVAAAPEGTGRGASGAAALRRDGRAAGAAAVWGWALGLVVAYDFDQTDDSLQNPYHETVYSLLDTLSPAYREVFGNALLQRLEALKRDSQS